MSKDTFFFPHDHNARGDEKIIKLLRALGPEGYGIYWILIEKLYEAGGKIEADFDAIAYDLRVEPKKIKSVATEFQLFYLSTSSGYLGSKSVDRRLEERRQRLALARLAGKASAESRKSTPVEHPFNARSTPVDFQLNHKERNKERNNETTAFNSTRAGPVLPLAKSVDPPGSVGKAGYSRIEMLERIMKLEWRIKGDHYGRRLEDLPIEYVCWALEELKSLGAEYRAGLRFIAEENGRIT